MSIGPTHNYDQAAAYLGVSVRWLRKQVARGHITFYWFGARKVCDEADLDRLRDIQKALAEQKATAPKVKPTVHRAAPVRNLEPIPVDDDIKAWVSGKAAA